MIWSRFVAAIVFYTAIPLSMAENGEFQTVSKLAPIVGLMIGGVLGGLDQGLAVMGMPLFTRSAVVVVSWIVLTGGLHLDGAMDTADGLAVTNPDRRLQVMSDSATGAFGAMAAVSLLLLKTAALADLPQGRWLGLLLACGWGRWAQQVAIARYPYLKPTGKGAFHKQAIPSLWNTLPSLLLLLGLSALPMWFPFLLSPFSSILYPLFCLAIALIVPAWFHHKLGGHTGDTYGATVEWTEALVLVLLTTMF